MKWKNYRTGDVLDFNSSNGIFHACNVSIEDNKTESNHPYVVRTSHNNGIRGYISEDESKLNPANTISFAQDTAQMFYQSEPYFTGNKVKVLSVKGHALTENIATFLITCMNKAFSNFAWGSSYDTKLLQNVMLSLPVKTKYIPDFNLMSEIIGGGISMSNVNTSSWKEFKLGELFEFTAIKQAKSQSMIPTDENGVNYIVQSTRNNMFSRKVSEQWLIDHSEAPVDGNCIVLGVTLPAVSYQPDRFGASQVIVARADFLNEAIGLWFVAMLEKQMVRFSYSSKPSLKAYREMSIKLPVKESEEIDWKFMEKYIHAVEKIVIKDVVDYKDSIIAKTKEIVV